MEQDREAILEELFGAKTIVNSDYRPTVGGGYPDSAQEGIVPEDQIVYVPGGYTTVGELKEMDTVGGFAMTGGARRRRARRRTQRGGKRRRQGGRRQNRSTFKLNLRAQIRLRSRSRSRSQRRY